MNTHLQSPKLKSNQKENMKFGLMIMKYDNKKVNKTKGRELMKLYNKNYS